MRKVIFPFLLSMILFCIFPLAIADTIDTDAYSFTEDLAGVNEAAKSVSMLKYWIKTKNH